MHLQEQYEKQLDSIKAAIEELHRTELVEDQQFPLIPLLPLFSSTQSTLWAVDISIEVKSSLNHAQNGFDMRSGIRLVRALNALSLSRT